MLKSSYQIARVWGIPIRLHISLILLLPLLVTDFGRLATPHRWAQVAVGVVMELGLLTSIALHELGHSIVAIRKNCRVREILLLPIGGAAQMERIPTRPMDELLMAIAGPAVSLLLALGGMAAALGLSGSLFSGWQGVLAGLLHHLTGRYTGLTDYILFWLGFVNLALVLFNLLPSFPMDGGRVLRAMLTSRLGRLRATAIAARLGKIMALLFGAYGYFSDPAKWTLVAIAFFIYIAAGNEYRMVQLQEAARRGNRWPFGPFRGPLAGEDETVVDPDEVTVSPPPYRDGPRLREPTERD